MPRPFRVELAEKNRKRGQAGMSEEVDQILRELYQMRTHGASPDPAASAPPHPPQIGAQAGGSVDNAIALWSGVEDIQKRIEITKKEIGALQGKGVAGEHQSRATEELRAVVTGTEQATDQILQAAETIDSIVQPIIGDDDNENRDDAQVIADNVISIFEACNFQDITGQRISKVVDSLQFIEERIAIMVDVWQTLDLGQRTVSDPGVAQAEVPSPQTGVPQAANAAPERTERPDAALMNGPALETDAGVVSQDDVDALFR